MRHIRKAEEPDALREWKGLQVEGGITPLWDDLPTDVGTALHDALLAEQGYVCCYCGGRVRGRHTEPAPEPVGDVRSHTEHFAPRTSNPSLALHYGNLLASCNGTGTDLRRSHCGRKKGDDLIPISPLDPVCERAFRYGASGSISPTDDPLLTDAARATSDVLGLSHPELTRRRRLAVDRHTEGIDKVSDEEIRERIRDCRERDADGEFEDCGHAAAYVLQSYL